MTFARVVPTTTLHRRNAREFRKNSDHRLANNAEATR